MIQPQHSLTYSNIHNKTTNGHHQAPTFMTSHQYSASDAIITTSYQHSPYTIIHHHTQGSPYKQYSMKHRHSSSECQRSSPHTNNHITQQCSRWKHQHSLPNNIIHCHTLPFTTIHHQNTNIRHHTTMFTMKTPACTAKQYYLPSHTIIHYHSSPRVRVNVGLTHQHSSPHAVFTLWTTIFNETPTVHSPSNTTINQQTPVNTTIHQ